MIAPAGIVTDDAPLKLIATSWPGSIAGVPSMFTERRAAPIVIGVVPKKLEKCSLSIVPERVGRNGIRNVCSATDGVSEFSGALPQAAAHTGLGGAGCEEGTGTTLLLEEQPVS